MLHDMFAVISERDSMEKTVSRLKKIQILDGMMLKIIAMISMIFDHAGDMFFPEADWFRMVGRLAMPLFSFCIAEGYIHTHDRKKYVIRMGIFLYCIC